MKRRVAPLLLAVGLLALLAARGRAQPPLRVGFAEVDITPPAGYPMAGYYHERLAVGVKDPLKAKAIVFLGEDEQAALVACDLTGIAVDLTQAVRQLASEKTGIPRQNIAITATHSHTAPQYYRDLYEYLGETAASETAASAAAAKHPYPAQLIESVAQAVIQAQAAAQPAAIAAGDARQQTPVSFNRRFVMADGSVRTWMRLDHPDVVAAAGPIDPAIGLALVSSAADGKPLGLLHSFALHLDTVGGMHWSGDYPSVIARALRQHQGPDFVALFGAGCCGDINHVDPSAKERAATDAIGAALAGTIREELPRLRPLANPRLRVKTGVAALPLQPITPQEIERAEAVVAAVASGQQVEFLEHVHAHKLLVLDRLRNKTPWATEAKLLWGLTRHWAGVGDALPVEVQVFALGRDLAVVCLPGEVFVDLGLAIKRASPFRTTLVIELTNCKETIYIPTQAAFASGSYEVTNSTTQPGSGEILAAAAVRLLREAAHEP
jgi:neutral ceramidase